MKFRSNARWNEPKENGTIFTLKNNGLGISIHRIIHIEDTWFLSCVALGISQRDLMAPDFIEAVRKAKVIIDEKIKVLREEFNKTANDDVIELE